MALVVSKGVEMSEQTKKTFEFISDPENSKLFTKEAALKAFSSVDLTNWPFQFYNSQRTPESKALSERRYTLKESNTELQHKEDLSKMEDALF